MTDIEWIIMKVNSTPQYFERHYMPALLAVVEKEERALRSAERKDDLPKIKYQVGRADGIQEAFNILGGLRKTSRKPSTLGK